MKRTSRGLLALAIVAGLAHFAPARLAAEERAVKIAGLGSMSGVDAVFGANAYAALRMAADEINRAGGVRLADGARGTIRLTYFNERSSPEEGIAITRRIAAEDWLAAIGPTCSIVAEPVFAALQRKVGDAADHGLQLPIFADVATKAGLARMSEWAFRNVPDEAAMYEHLFRWLKEKHPGLKTLAGGVESDLFHSRGAWARVKGLAPRMGYDVVAEEKWQVKDTAFAAQVGRWRQANPDVIVVAARPPSACGALREMKRQEVRPKLLVGISSTATLEMLRDCGPEAEGIVVATSFAPVAPEARRVAEAVAGRYGGTLDLHSAAAYENMQVLKRVIEGAGVEAKPATVQSDRRKLRDALAGLKEFPGLLGVVRRTDDRESLKPYVFVQARASAWVVLHQGR